MSLYYLAKFTEDSKYKTACSNYIDSLMATKTGSAFANVANLEFMILEDSMNHFFMSATLKFLFLCVGNHKMYSFNSVAFSNQGHIIKKFKAFQGR